MGGVNEKKGLKGLKGHYVNKFYLHVKILFIKIIIYKMETNI